MRDERILVPARHAAGLYKDQPIPGHRRPKGRVCTIRGCTTILSMYTRGLTCWVHEPNKVPRAEEAV